MFLESDNSAAFQPPLAPGLLSTLGLMRGNPLPMLLWWGEALEPHCNDAYLQMLGRGTLALSPAGWGQDWDTVRADLDQVRSTGEIVWHENVPLTLPHTPPGEFRGTYSYSPVLTESGVAGVLFMCTRHYRASTVQATAVSATPP